MVVVAVVVVVVAVQEEEEEAEEQAMSGSRKRQSYDAVSGVDEEQKEFFWDTSFPHHGKGHANCS